MKKPIRILYVDDSLLDRELVRDVLEREHSGFEIVEAKNKTEFVDRLAQGSYDLVLSDLHILGFQGFQVLDMVRAQNPFMPVIIVTGTGTEETAVEAMKRGVADYVIKTPHHIRRLPLTIVSALAKQRLEEERRQAFEALQEREQQLRALAESLEERVRKRTEALREKHEEVSRLASALTLAEQAERRRIARLLHDDLQQILYGLRVRLHVLGLDFSVEMMPGLAEHLDYIRQGTEQAIDVTRTLSAELNPPVLKGEELEAALHWLAQHMEEAYDLTVHLKVQGDLKIYSEDKRLFLVQLVRELLFNVAKHAKVDEAWIEAFSKDRWLIIRVEDEGVGFDREKVKTRHWKNSLGLFSVRERLGLFCGRMEVDSQPGQGSRITIAVPLDREIAELNLDGDE
jgi:signal transduction histidine kinase